MKKKTVLFLCLILTLNFFSPTVLNIHVEAKKVKVSVDVKILSLSKDKIRLRTTNNGKKKYSYSLGFSLKKHDDNKWESIELTQKFTNKVQYLKGKDCISKIIKWNKFIKSDNLPVGKYKMTWMGETLAFEILEDDKVKYDKALQGDVYNPKKAVEYAYEWYDKINPEYGAVKGNGECTNFASQCLYAAGFQMTDEWHSYGNRKKDKTKRWWKSYYLYKYLASKTEIDIIYTGEYPKNKKKRKDFIKQLEVGDFIFYIPLSSPEIPEKSSDIHHTAIITKIKRKQNTVLVTYQSISVKNGELPYGHSYVVAKMDKLK